MPCDFFDVVQFRYYLDSVDEVLGYYEEIDEPCEYVKMTPKLFNKWSAWARKYKPKESEIMRPFGEKIGPDWARTEFNNLEDFYIFYRDLLEVE